MKKINKTNIFYILLGIIFISVCVKAYNSEGFGIKKRMKKMRKGINKETNKRVDLGIKKHIKEDHD